MQVPEREWDCAVKVLREAPWVALVCHVDPDGDALGSMLACDRALRSLGVRTVASFGVGPHGGHGDGLAVPPQYAFLPGVGDLVTPETFPAAPDVLVSFDCASPDRLGSLQPAAEAARTVIVIDHHASGTQFGDIRLLDKKAAATAVLVEELIRRLGVPLDRDMAACLYVALVTDTGRFQFASTTPAVMEMGARLLEHDIDHAAINRRVWDTHSFGYLKVLGRALQRAALVPRVGLAWTAVLRSDLAEEGVDAVETEGLIDVLRSVDSADTTLVCKEQDDGAWKGSLRTKGAVDVGEIAAGLGGGGHAMAAGFTVDGALDDVVGRVVALLDDVRAAGESG